MTPSKEYELARDRALGRTQGLLGKFVINKGLSYAEPSRKGTAKGEPIGFGRQKYMATLYLLLDLSLRQVAEISDISYGLLRKWRTEQEFNETVEGHKMEFLGLLEKRLNDITREEQAHFDKYVNESSFADLASGRYERPPLSEDLFDLEIYGYTLRVDVVTYLGNIGLKKNDLTIVFWAISLGEFFKSHPAKGSRRVEKKIGTFFKSHPAKGVELEQAEKELKSRLLRATIDDILKLLKKPSMTEADRKQAVALMALVKQAMLEY